jgi:hypothetical protein
MTLKELENMLIAERYNSQSYCIGSGWPRLGDGFAVDKGKTKFEFFYVERGHKSPMKEFDTEEEAADFAYEFLSNEKWTRSHNVGFYSSKEEAERRMSVLREAGIEYFNDVIPYGGPNDPRYRIFVFGKDIDRVKELDGE